MIARNVEDRPDAEKKLRDAATVRKIRGENEDTEGQIEIETQGGEEGRRQSRIDLGGRGQSLVDRLVLRVRREEEREEIETGKETGKETGVGDEVETKETNGEENGVSLPKERSRRRIMSWVIRVITKDNGNQSKSSSQKSSP